jgi:hypothetical protein
MTKSILSEQREADEERCEWLLTIAAECRERNPWGSAASAIESAVARIRALSEALREACHERDGLLAKVEMMGWNPSETAPSGPRVLARGRWMPLPAPPGEKRWGAP